MSNSEKYQFSDMDKATNRKVSDFIFGIKKAYLLGSYAKKNETIDSDIDLALIVDQLPDEERFDLRVQLMLIAADFDISIEPYPFSNEDFNSENPFVFEILNTGIEVNI